MSNCSGTQIKLYRKKNKLTQVQLGAELRVAQSTVAMWETGESMPRANMLLKLARVFGCSIDELLVSNEALNQRH